MSGSFLRRLTCAALVTAGVVAGGASAATAADTTFDFPAGTACQNFDLHVEITGGNQVTKIFTAQSGNVPTLSAGTGSPSHSRTSRLARLFRSRRKVP